MESKDYVLLAGVLVTLCLGVWNLVHGYRTTRKTSFINTVTAQRIQWIELVRQDVARFTGLTHYWAMLELEGKPESAEVLKEADRLRYVIRLRLNPKDPPDQEIASLVKRIPELTHESMRTELLAALESLTVATQHMLKNEWDKVKAEAKEGDLMEIDKFKLNQNLWGLLLAFGALGAAEYYKLRTLYWFALLAAVVMSLSVLVTTIAYTRNYWRDKMGDKR